PATRLRLRWNPPGRPRPCLLQHNRQSLRQWRLHLRLPRQERYPPPTHRRLELRRPVCNSRLRYQDLHCDKSLAERRPIRDHLGRWLTHRNRLETRVEIEGESPVCFEGENGDIVDSFR